MLIWQVADGDFYSINLHHDGIVLWIHLNITVGKMFEILVLWLFSIQVYSFVFLKCSTN